MLRGSLLWVVGCVAWLGGCASSSSSSGEASGGDAGMGVDGPEGADDAVANDDDSTGGDDVVGDDDASDDDATSDDDAVTPEPAGGDDDGSPLPGEPSPDDDGSDLDDDATADDIPDPSDGGASGSGEPEPGPMGMGGASGGTSGDGGAENPPAGSGLGLAVVDNQIVTPNGEPFRGRGANFNDTRSCDACTYLPPDVEGLNRWADELFDVWGANFVRFNLMSFTSDNGFRQQWQSVVDDPGYLADIADTVTHMTSKEGVYVMVTLFADPSMKENNEDYDSEWPTAETLPVYELLAETFAHDEKVLFGLTNEPHGPEDRNPELAQRYLDSIDVIRAVEASAGVPEHIVVVQAPQQWARYLDYFIEEPLPRSNVAYEVHVYNPEPDFDGMLRVPKETLPVLVGEYGPSAYSTEDDIRALWDLCQELEIPHLAWTFHMRCDPSLLEDTADDGCGLSSETGYDFPRTSWGDMLYEYLQSPW